ncbi:MAG: glycosyltransferase family 4 protein, partial [Muribaculaceae bacterium]|nr:glycosyltransferase family 4 protein [Muribaculaceae bacterium]
DVSPLVRRIRELGIEDRVEWLGYVNDIHRRIRELGVYVGVIPSRVPEAFGLALVDYMSCGVPVISSNNGAQPEIVTAGNDGLLVSPDDPSALASALDRILGDPSMRDRMADAALATVASRFSYNRFITDIIRTYIPQ